MPLLNETFVLTFEFSLLSLHFHYSLMRPHCVLGPCKPFYSFWMLLLNHVYVIELNIGFRLLLIGWFFWVLLLFETVFKSI